MYPKLCLLYVTYQPVLLYNGDCYIITLVQLSLRWLHCIRGRKWSERWNHQSESCQVLPGQRVHLFRSSHWHHASTSSQGRGYLLSGYRCLRGVRVYGSSNAQGMNIYHMSIKFCVCGPLPKIYSKFWCIYVIGGGGGGLTSNVKAEKNILSATRFWGLWYQIIFWLK